MNSLSLQQIRQLTGGKALSRIPLTAASARAVCHDTRHLESGCLFVAIKGDNFDAHRFLPDAASKGAIAALVEEMPFEALPNVHLIQVANTRKAMGKLAAYVRSKLRAKVIAVGGSNGKTSTKYLIDSVLGSALKGSMSPKSFNNDIGVPMSIFAADPSQDYLVLEIGTNHPGEVRTLTNVAQPDIAVITNIGAEHLEGFGDLMGVRQEEASIIAGLDANGILVVNGDDQELLDAVAPHRGKRVTFGFNETNDLFPRNIRCDRTGTRFSLNGRRDVFVPMLGRHSAVNALAAIAVARRMNMNEDQIIEALATAHGPEMRLQLQQADRGITVINDAYNANPHSMQAALETLVHLKSDGRRVAVLGDMRELGDSSERYHRELGQRATECSLDLLVCVGDQARLSAESARGHGMDRRQVLWYSNTSEAAQKLPGSLIDGDLVLVKASRGIQLEIVAKAIVNGHGDSLRKIAS